MFDGVRFLPPAVMMMSFLRPVIFRKPSSSSSPRSPVCSQPSTSVSAVASGLRQYSRNTFGPRTRISPSSSAIRISTPGSGLPDGAELEVVERADGADGGGLGHAPALHHRHPRGVEELEDLRRDRRGAGDRLRGPGRRTARRTREKICSSACSNGAAQLLGDRLSALPAAANLDAQLDRLLEALLSSSTGLLLQLHRRRVELLEDPRHRRDVGRLGLDQLREDLLGVAAEVDDRRALVEGGELGGEREYVREREVQVGDLAGLDELELLDHLAHRHRVAVGEHDALGGPRGPGRVDDRVRVVGLDRRLAAARARRGRRSRPRARSSSSVSSPPSGLDPDHVLELRQPLADLLDLRQLGGVLAEDRAGARVAQPPTRTPRASWWGTPGRRRRPRPRSRSWRASTRAACWHRMQTRSPGSIPSSINPSASSSIIVPNSA